MEQQRQILPAPEPLTSRSGLDTSMRAKFAIDGLAIGLPKAQFYYVYSRLGAFQTTFLPYVTRATDFDRQPDAFLTYISDTLGESHKERRAALNLVKLRQGQNESLTMYVSRWEYTLFEAGSNHFSDHVRIILLSAGLRNEYKNDPHVVGKVVRTCFEEGVLPTRDVHGEGFVLSLPQLDHAYIHYP